MQFDPLMFNTVDAKPPAPVGKFSSKYFLHHRCWMLSQQDIYYEMLPFFNAVCAAILFIYVYIRKKPGMLVASMPQKSMMTNCQYTLRTDPPTKWPKIHGLYWVFVHPYKWSYDKPTITGDFGCSLGSLIMLGLKIRHLSKQPVISFPSIKPRCYMGL